jgi:hypothetical protein
MQKLFTILLLFTAQWLTAQIPTNGLIRYYPFNGNAKDLSPNAQHGTVVGATLTTDRFGHPNSAYFFDQTATNRIDIPINGLLLNQYSYSAWALLSNLPANGDQFIIFDVGSDTGDQYLNVANQAYGTYTGWNGGSYNTNSVHLYVPPGPLPSTNEWVHMVGVRYGNYYKYYVNGILAATDSSLVASVPFYGIGTPYAEIGTRYNGTLSFNGKIDDVRIYNRPLTPDEVEALYTEGLCFQTVKVTDTLVINTHITGFNPVTYQYSIKMFPNPANDHLNIDCGANFAELAGHSIKITNSLGQQLFQTLISQQMFTIDLATWNGNGTYFVYLLDPQGNIQEVKKIIIQ